MTATGTSAWLIGLGRVSAKAGALVLVVLIVQLLLRKQLAPRWRCALWLLVAVRLLLPVSFGSVVSIFNVIPPLRPSVLESPKPGRPLPTPNRGAQFNPPAPAPTQMPSDSFRNLAAADDSVPGGGVSQVRGETQPTKHEVPVQASPAIRVRQFSWAQIIFAIWFGGALLLGACVAVRSIRLMRRLSNLPTVTDDAVLETLAECRRLLRVRARLTVVESAEVSTPALHGLLRLRLLLPHGFPNKFSSEELRFVLLHELAHVKNKDGLQLDYDLSALPEEQRSESEVRADTLASATVVPQGELEDFIGRTRPIYSAARIEGFAAGARSDQHGRLPGARGRVSAGSVSTQSDFLEFSTCV